MVVAVESDEVMETCTATEPTLGRALGAVAETAIDQMRDLAVAQLDEWATRIHDRLSSLPVEPTSATPGMRPLIVGALAGAAVAWLIAGRRSGA